MAQCLINGNDIYLYNYYIHADLLVPDDHYVYLRGSSFDTDKIPAGVYNISFFYHNFNNSRLEVAHIGAVELKPGTQITLSPGVNTDILLDQDYEWIYTIPSSTPRSYSYIRLGDVVPDMTSQKFYHQVLLSDDPGFDAPQLIALMREEDSKIFTKPVDTSLPQGFWHANSAELNPVDIFGTGEFVAYDFRTMGFQKPMLLKNSLDGSFREATLTKESIPGLGNDALYTRYISDGAKWIPKVGAVGAGSNILPYPVILSDEEEENAAKIVAVRKISNGEVVYKNDSLYQDLMASADSIESDTLCTVISDNTLSISGEGSIYCNIYDVSGKLLSRHKGFDSMDVELHELSSGCFIAEVGSGNCHKSLKIIR